MCCPAPLFFFDVLGSNWGQNQFFCKKAKKYSAESDVFSALFLETHVTNDTMHTRKAKGVRSAPHSTSNFLHQLRPIFQNKHDFSISMHHCFFYSSQPQLCIKFRQHPILSA